MTGNVGDRIAPRERARKPREHPVLRAGVRLGVGAFQLDADRIIVAARTAAPRRFAGVPGALRARDELHQPAVAANQEMRRHAQRRDRRVVRVGHRVETVREEPLDPIAPELSRRERDAVDDDQRDRGIRGPRIAVGRRDLRGEVRAPGGVDGEPAAAGIRGDGVFGPALHDGTGDSPIQWARETPARPG